MSLIRRFFSQMKLLYIGMYAYGSTVYKIMTSRFLFFVLCIIFFMMYDCNEHLELSTKNIWLYYHVDRFRDPNALMFSELHRSVYILQLVRTLSTFKCYEIMKYVLSSVHFFLYKPFVHSINHIHADIFNINNIFF